MAIEHLKHEDFIKNRTIALKGVSSKKAPLLQNKYNLFLL